MELERIAARITQPLPDRIAFIGDSLTALNPERNYVSQVEKALRGGYEGNVEVVNAGVGGDTIERVEARLDGVLARRPDGAFVFVGHNDSKILWRPDTQDYGPRMVPAGRFEASYRRVIDTLRKGGVAWLTLISPTASCEPRTRAVHEQKKAEGLRHNFFGKLDVMEEYLAIVKRLAAELNCGFLDLFHPMHASPDWDDLTDEGGVHLSEAGDRFVAERILTYLAGDAAGGTGGDL